MKVLTAVSVAVLSLTSCSRNPETAKKRYMENGKKYFDRGMFKQAKIMYKDAIQKDRLFGPAYYRLGLTAMKLTPPAVAEAVSAFRRAIELLKPEDPDHWNAVVRISEIYLAVGRNPQQKQFLVEAEQYCDQLLKRDPNSFDGHRLMGELKFIQAVEQYRMKKPDDGRKLIDTAIAELNTANSIKPGQVEVLMLLGRAYAGLARLPEAEKLYRSALASDRNYQPVYLDLYAVMMAQQRSADAEQVLKDAFKAFPKEYLYLTRLAMHYASQGRRDEMIGVLQQIKGFAKDYDQAYLVVGDFYLRLGEGESAVREYREGMAKDLKKKLTYQKRIIEVLLRQGKQMEGADLNAQILKENPNDNDAKGLAASFLIEKGEINRALTDLQAVVTRAPDNPVARYNLGRAHLARREVEQARQAFTKAIEIRPDYVLARLALAQLQISKFEFESALKTAASILGFDRGNVNARLIESAALMGQRKYGDSRALLDAMLKANPNSADVYYQLGVVNLAEQKYKEAEDAFRKSYQMNPANSRGLMGIVETAFIQGKTDLALQLLRAEAEKNPNRPDFRLELGNASARVGRFDEAITEYQKLLSISTTESPRRADLLVRIGEVYRRKGDYANAVTNLEQARRILPDNINAVSALALSLDQGGRWPEAKQAYEAALKIDANHGYSLNNLAFLIAEHGGDLDDALAKAQRAKALLPSLAEVSDTLGWIYLKKNLSDQAVDVFKNLVAKTPNHSTFRYHLGMALNQKGDRTRAIKELQEALKNSPPKAEKDKIQALLTQLGA